MSTLRCPRCDYDVRGSLLWQNTVRCPECGVVVSLDALAAFLVRRRKKTRSMWMEFAGAVAVMMIVLLGNILYDAPPGLELFEKCMLVLSVEPALIVALLAIPLMLGITCRSWSDLFTRHRVAFVCFAVLVVLIFPPTAALLLLLLSLLAFGVFCRDDEGEHRARSADGPFF